MIKGLLKKAVTIASKVVDTLKQGANQVKLALGIGAGVAAAGSASAQTNGYSIPDATGLTSAVQAPVNGAAGWWMAIIAFVIVSGWVVMMLRRKR